MLSSWFTFFLNNLVTSINGQRHIQVLHNININMYYINKKKVTGRDNGKSEQLGISAS